MFIKNEKSLEDYILQNEKVDKKIKKGSAEYLKIIKEKKKNYQYKDLKV